MGKKPVPNYVRDIRNNNYSYDKITRILFKNLKISTYPINVFKIAKEFQFDIFYGIFKQDNISGAMWDGDTPINVGDKTSSRFILLNKNDDINRQAFTVAHELGHFLLDCNDNSNFYERYHGDEKQTGDEKEMEDRADQMAANILMPSWFIEAYVSYIRKAMNMPRENLVEQMTKDFNVEKAAASKRLDELKIV